MLKHKCRHLCAALLGLLAGANAFGSTVSLSLTSSVGAEVLQPGDDIDWTIQFSVSTGDNLGLAFISVDFIQSPYNPGKILIPSATSVPTEMADFARPDGISSPGTGGYRGTPVGDNCYTDLYCIGGAQNTLGVAGTNMGTDITVDGGIGQSGNVTLGTGVFEAPDDRGVYVFTIENCEANTLDSINQSGASPVSEASITYNDASFYVIVCPGDVNADGGVDMSDLSAVLSSYGKCTGDTGFNEAADLNRDGCVGLGDLAIVQGNYGSVCAE